MSLAHLTAISPDPKPPATLSALARAQWRRYVREFDLDDEHAQFLLGEAMAACDRVLEARASIAKYGAVIVTATGELKTNPSTVVERDSAARMLACLKALNINCEPMHDRVGRPNEG